MVPVQLVEGKAFINFHVKAGRWLKIPLALLFCLFITSAMAQEATEIVRKADAHARGISSMAIMNIQTIRPSWSREMSVKAWSKGKDYFLILIQSPARDKGVAFLKRNKEVWNWIPSIERNIKMPPSMMSQSWMGTDFTNDDLVKEASILEDYYHTLMKDTIVQGYPCYNVRLIPKSDADVIWGKILMCIDKKDYMTLHVRYYDEDGELVNTMVGTEIKMLGGRMLPSRLEMFPEDKKGNKTVLLYKSLQFDVPVNDAFFTSQNLSKVK